jgi:hypothetical protein
MCSTEGDFAAGVLNTNDTYYKRARAAVQVDARSETELGTLRGYIHLNFNWDTTTTPALLDLDGDDVLDEVATSRQRGRLRMSNRLTSSLAASGSARRIRCSSASRISQAMSCRTTLSTTNRTAQIRFHIRIADRTA